MNVNAEIKAIGVLIGRTQEQAERGELTPEDRVKAADHLDRHLSLVKGHMRTEDFVAFQRSVEADLEKLSATHDADDLL